MTDPTDAVLLCDGCDAELAPGMTACPACGRLVHAVALGELAATARSAEAAGDLSAALAAWRDALPLLPVDSRQRQGVEAKIADLGRRLPAGGPVAKRSQQSPAGRVAGTVGAMGLAAWKFKVLLLGLTKGSTVLSMLLSMGVYWSVWGWRFAVGFVLQVYVHEMGHVIALRRYGFRATAPMFIPGIGALIRLQQQVVDPQEDADIGLAGPIYGLGAALVLVAAWAVTRQPILLALAGFGAWVNLFNLTPIGFLDGGRAFHALSRAQRVLMVAVVAGCWAWTRDGMLVLVGLVAVGRVVADPPAVVAGSRRTAATYAGLVVALAAVALAHARVGVPR